METLTGSKLPFLVLPSVNKEVSIYCGPYALSVILNKDPEDIIGAFQIMRRDGGDIKSTNWKELLFFLKFCGMVVEEKVIPYEASRLSIRTLFETYNSLSNTLREETCIARVGNHFIVINRGLLTCSITKSFKHYTDREYIRKQITNIAVVRKAD